MAWGEKEGKEGGKDELGDGIFGESLRMGSIKSAMSPKFRLLQPPLLSQPLGMQRLLVDTWVCHGGRGSKGTGNRKKSNWQWLELGCMLEELSTLPASLLAHKKGKQRSRVQINGH